MADQEPEDEGGVSVPSEESEGDDMGVKGSSEFAKTTILFPDFQDKSECCCVGIFVVLTAPAPAPPLSRVKKSHE